MRPKSLVPKPYHHKSAGQDAVVLRDRDGSRRTVYLGEHGTAAARRRYREVLAEYLAGRPVATVREAKHAPSEWPTVAQLVAAYLLHAERYYRDAGGAPTGEVVHARIALEPLVRLHRADGQQPAARH